MGVYIKGMTMPKAGNWKTIRIYYDGTCAEPNWQGDCKYMQGCEAVPVPPHGDLIDRDALMDDIIGSMVFSGREVPKEAAIVQKVLDIVGDANAIIPAEEEET